MNQKYFTEEEKKEAKRKKDKRNAEKYRRKKGILPRKKFKNKEEKEIYLKTYRKEYYQTRKEKYLKRQKSYRKNHKKEINIYQQIYSTNRLKTDINFKLSHYLRVRVRKAIHNNQKSGSAVKDLGCSIPELKLYLEARFQLGMSWDNWSYEGWHIDHIIPLDFFNLQNREEFLKACHYTNLQPLWATENFIKSNKNNENHK